MKLHPFSRKAGLIALACLVVVIGIFAPGEIAGLRRFNALVKTHNHTAAAMAAMDTVMKLNTNRVFLAESGYGDLPKVLATMNPRSVEITPRSMRVVLHGGIYPYGFQLLRTQDGWDYSWYSGWRSRVLHSIRNR